MYNLLCTNKKDFKKKNAERSILTTKMIPMWDKTYANYLDSVLIHCWNTSTHHSVHWEYTPSQLYILRINLIASAIKTSYADDEKKYL
jgi:hypothetical protein